MKKNAILESVMRIIFFIAACASVLAVVLICVFLFANGIPAMGEVGIFKFLFGQLWRPSNDIYGILPFILGSIYVTAGAIVVGVPQWAPFQIYESDRCGISDCNFPGLDFEHLFLIMAKSPATGRAFLLDTLISKFA